MDTIHTTGDQIPDLTDRIVDPRLIQSFRIVLVSADEGGEWTMTLNGDGTGKFVSVENGGEPETTDITWELTDEGFRTKGDTKLKFTDEGDNIRT
jgi:hypothetical protein